MTGWLGVVSAEHVQRGVRLGIAQIGHGKRGGLARMNPGDTLVYYSAVHSLGDTATLRHFTALGAIADEEIWQANEGDFQPWRRRAHYEAALTSTPTWGYQLRRGLVPLDPADVDVLRRAMRLDEAR